jgi:hypothetical protein
MQDQERRSDEIARSVLPFLFFLHARHINTLFLLAYGLLLSFSLASLPFSVDILVLDFYHD